MNQEAPSYHPLVKLHDVEDFREPGDRQVTGDRRDGKLYRYTEEMKLAVNVAVATGRPLLLLGPSGSGKSSIAFNLARVMGRRYYEFVVSSRSEAQDLFYRFDAVRRLGDAQLGDRGSGWQRHWQYIEPGPLWWMLDPQSARMRGTADAPSGIREAMDPALFDPDRSGTAPAVLLLDEIDKAEPDFANDLLVPLASRQFSIPELGLVIGFPQYDRASSREPVVVITSNRERELPEAFVRRCIVLEIAPPTEQELVDIARIIYGAGGDAEDYREIARTVAKSSGAATSIAEFLDTLRALEQLRAHDPTLRERIVKSTTWRARESRSG